MNGLNSEVQFPLRFSVPQYKYCGNRGTGSGRNSREPVKYAQFQPWNRLEPVPGTESEIEPAEPRRVHQARENRSPYPPFGAPPDYADAAKYYTEEQFSKRNSVATRKRVRVMVGELRCIRSGTSALEITHHLARPSAGRQAARQRAGRPSRGMAERMCWQDMTRHGSSGADR